MQAKTLGELAAYVGGIVIGDSDRIIKAVATLEQAKEGDITFLSNSKYTNLIKSTKASAIITKEQLDTGASQVIAEDPYYAITQIMILLYGHRQHKKCGISKLASIAKNAKIGKDCHIQDFVSIGDNVVIGDGCVIYPGVFVGPDTTIGNNCIIYPNAVIYDDCRIGDRVIIQANATIGEDGYGFATHNGVHYKIPQIGRTIIEDDVEIGSGCAIERGAIDDTVIGCGSKLGDLVAIGHGTKIGPHCLVVAHTGIAGSATIGHHCVLGGQVGVVGHIKVGNCVKVGAQAGVINDIPDGQTIVGSPAIEAGLAKRAYSLIQYLPQMRQSIRRLEKLVGKKDQSGKADSD